MPNAGILILALDAASSLSSATLWQTAPGGGFLRAAAARSGTTGDAALLPVMVADLLAEAGATAADLGAVAVNIGPGSFTGLRASIALAEGLALGTGCPVVPVTIAEAFAADLAAAAVPGGAIWCALDARQGRIFLHQGAAPADWSVANLADPPRPAGPVWLTGDAAAALGEAYGQTGIAAQVTDARQSDATLVARAAVARMAGDLPALAATPLYIDPPRALLPRGGLRPPPLGWTDPS